MLDKIKSNRVLPGLPFTLASAAVSFVLSWSLFSGAELTGADAVERPDS